MDFKKMTEEERDLEANRLDSILKKLSYTNIFLIIINFIVGFYAMELEISANYFWLTLSILVILNIIRILITKKRKRVRFY